jgi:hypothetical protein
MRRVIRSLAICALLAGCSGGQADVDNVDSTSDPLPSAIASSEPSAVVSSEPTAAPSSTGVNAIGKLGKICTQIGCRDQLVLQAPNVTLAKGTYFITVDADGKKASCKLELAGKEIKTEGCVGEAEVQLALPGSVPVRGAEGGFSLVFVGAPGNVKLTVTSAAKKKVAEQVVTPTYKTLQPNGPDCSPTCKQAQEALTLK